MAASRIFRLVLGGPEVLGRGDIAGDVNLTVVRFQPAMTATPFGGGLPGRLRDRRGVLKPWGGVESADMATFRVVLIEHGYSTTRYERDVVEAAGGELVDADELPLDEAFRLCETADGILCRRIQVSRDLLSRFRHCKVIVRYGVGTDNIDVDAATDLGVMVGHVPSYCADEVSSHAIALLLASVRHVTATDHRLRGGGWDVHRGEFIHRMAGKTLGLVGLGGIGRTVALKMSGWGLRLLAADPFVDPVVASRFGVELVGFDRLTRESDFLSLHCPLLPETHHLVGRQALSSVKPGAVLVNTARGPLVDGESLIDAIDSGRLGGAALDVFELEPLPAESPLRRHDRIVITDHTAWYSEESQEELQRTAADVVVRACTGGLPHSLANPLVLKRLGRWEEWEPAENMRWQLKRLGVAAPGA
jgi:D-3-phosphoglycerate dehydrogenase / 2-oxoglutarate reductase